MRVRRNPHGIFTEMNVPFALNHYANKRQRLRTSPNNGLRSAETVLRGAIKEIESSVLQRFRVCFVDKSGLDDGRKWLTKRIEAVRVADIQSSINSSRKVKHAIAHRTGRSKHTIATHKIASLMLHPSEGLDPD